MIIDPRGLTVIEWTDYMNDELTGFALVPRLDDPNQWREWAASVIQEPEISRFNPPNPWNFSDWMEWAFRFNEVVDLGT